jgi:trehalose/maltose hydrolase-like predicted phosphorylase
MVSGVWANEELNPVVNPHLICGWQQIKFHLPVREEKVERESKG